MPSRDRSIYNHSWDGYPGPAAVLGEERAKWTGRRWRLVWTKIKVRTKRVRPASTRTNEEKS